MGHLINPISLRLGWTYNWDDLYFIESIYYPEYLHIIFKIKLYLIYFFGLKEFEKQLALFYSHFEIIKVYKNVFIRAYLYHGKVESLIADFFSENFKEIKKDRLICNILSRRRRKYKDVGHIEAFMIMLTFKLFSTFYWNEWPVLLTKKFIYLLEDMDFSGLCIILKKRPFCLIEKNSRVSFLYFFSLFLYLVEIYENENNEVETHYLEIIRKFLYGYLWLTCFNVFFKNIAKWINSFFYFLFGLKNVITQIFVISNDDVTAKFISRYMARKYQQGFGIMEIVNPLTKELKTLAESFQFPLILNAYNKFKNKNKIFVNHYRGLFKNFLMIMSTAFIYEIYKFYKYRYIWLTFEFIILSIVNFKKFKKPNILIGLSKKLIKNRIGFFLFFNKKILFYKNILFNSALIWNKFILRSFVDFFEFYKAVMEELETFNFVFFWISNISVNTQIVNFFMKGFNKFVSTTYNNFYYLYDYNNVNKLKIRNSIRALDDKGRGIIGFKFQIKGRFSRKQKASSVSFRQGLMPLNTISAHIEYAYYVSPIENSAAIVKVWIYRKGCTLTNWLLQIV